MKKEDFKAALDLIEPDAYFETRLKARINYERKPKMKLKKFSVGLIAAVVVIAIAVGVYFPAKNHNDETTLTSSPSDSQTPNSEKTNSVNPFIMVAGAIEDKEALKNDTAFKTLNFNENFPYGYKVTFESAKGMSEEERVALVEKRNNEILESFESDAEKFDSRTGNVVEKDGLIFTAVTFNNFKLKFDDFENVESVTAELSSGWGEINYYVDMFVHSEKLAFLKGQKCTIKTDGTTLKYDEATSRFKWKCSDKMLAAIAENPDIKLSSFSDTITFTVLHKDKTKEVGVVDVTFDDDGNATFTNRGYSFYEN